MLGILFLIVLFYQELLKLLNLKSVNYIFLIIVLIISNGL